MTTCASCGVALVAGGGAERPSPAGLICGPCAGEPGYAAVLATVRAALPQPCRKPGMSRNMRPLPLSGGRYDGRKGRKHG